MKQTMAVKCAASVSDLGTENIGGLYDYKYRDAHGHSGVLLKMADTRLR